MNMFSLLKADHRKIEGLFSRLESLNIYKHAPRYHLFDRLKEELEHHALAEEAIFYPAIKGLARTHSLALESFEKHHVIHILLAELAHSNINKEEWEAKLAVLKEQVSHHVKEEEEQLFPRAEKILSNAQQTEIARQIQEWKTQHTIGSKESFLSRFFGLAKTP